MTIEQWLAKIEAMMRADHPDAMMTKLEAFAGHFVQLATSAGQRRLAAEFDAFVHETIRELNPGTGKADETLIAPDPEFAAYIKESGHESLSALFAEIRADEAAAKREDAHWYGQDAFRKLLDGKCETPANESEKDQGIER